MKWCMRKADDMRCSGDYTAREITTTQVELGSSFLGNLRFCELRSGCIPANVVGKAMSPSSE